MRNLIVRTMAATTIGLTALTVPVGAASAAEQRAICVQDYDGSWFSIITEDSPEDAAYIGNRRTKPFPYGVGGGCSAYTYGLAEEQCNTEREAVASQLAVAVNRADEAEHEVRRQQVVIDRLRAKIKRLKGRR